MKKKLLALALAVALVVSLCPAAAAVTSYKSWSQGDSQWGSLPMGGAGSDTMKKAGCLITAVAKMLVYSGQQDETFTPGKCLDALKESDMLTSGGAMRSGNYNKSFLPTYAPELKHESSAAHSSSPWGQDKAVSEISSKLNNSYYVIVCVKNTSTGNTHWMLVDRVENGDVYVMDNGGVVPLYGTKKYSGGVIDQSYFKYSGTGSKPPVSDTTVTDNGPVISPTTEPGQDLPQGKPFYFKGKITSVSKVTSATISILSADGQTTLQTKTIKPNTLTVDIATSGLDALKFGQLSPGSYLFKLTATSQSGKTSTWQKGFSIAGTTPTPAAPAASTLTISPTTQPSERMAYQAPFSFEGTITSNYDITYVYAAVKDRDNGMAYLTRDDSPLVKKYDIKTSILNDLRLDQFATGRYTLVVTAKDASGKEAIWQRDFSIEKPATPEPSKPQDTGYTLTINYYMDDKLVQTDHCPGGNSVSAYIYEMPEKYHRQTFRYSTTNSGIGVFQTELWVPALSQNDTIDLYVSSGKDDPVQSVNSYEVKVIMEDEKGNVLGSDSVYVAEGDKFYYRLPEYNGYKFWVTGSDYKDCFLRDDGLVHIPAVYYAGTVQLFYQSLQAEPEPIVSPQPTTAPKLSSTGGLSNFRAVNAYYSGLFDDVAASDWFDENVDRAYGLGLMKGVSQTNFDPRAPITVAQAVTLAARLHSIYHTGSENFVQSGKNWYDVYMTYAAANGIPTKPSSWLKPTDIITRKDFVAILTKALPAEALPAILDDVYFDDLTGDTSGIYLLARAGVIRGVPNVFGTLDFQPDTSITRAEVAAIVTRMADPALRQ